MFLKYDILGAMIMFNFPFEHWPVYVSIAVFSLLIPLGIFIGRSNIRLVRRDIVRDLESLFDFAEYEGQKLILPSFELVKYKYNPKENPHRSKSDADGNSFVFYIFPVIIYILLSFLCFKKAFDGGKDSLFAAPEGLFGALTYTFLASYLSTVRYFIRRISNFDLSPISFYQSTLHIIQALFVSAAIFQTKLPIFTGGGFDIAVFFVIGFYPNLFLDR